MSDGRMEPSRSTCGQSGLKGLTYLAMWTLLPPTMVLQVSLETSTDFVSSAKAMPCACVQSEAIHLASLVVPVPAK